MLSGSRLFRGLVLLCAGLLAGVPLGLMIGQGSGPGPEPASQPDRSDLRPAAAERQVLFWYDPMYPGTRFDAPGPSPFMDMDLVPRYADQDAGTGIRIDPAQTANLAVRTRAAVLGRLSFSRDLPASVEFNDYQLARIQARADGFVEDIPGLAVGDPVRAGQVLAGLTVPEWASDQSEYLLLKARSSRASVVAGVRERLRLSGMPDEMLAAVDASGKIQTRLEVRSPISGVLTSLDVYPGMNVDRSMTLATVRGMDPVWILAEVPEKDLHLLEGSGRVRVSVPAWPDRVFRAESQTLLPKASPETRTVPLRLSLPNPEGLLRPGMTASVRLRGQGEEAVLIPTSSLIDLGREQRVIVRSPDGGFVPRSVSVLRSSRDMTALASGVEPGEEVVVTGLFLIDSEANLRGALDRMRADQDIAVQADDQGGQR